MLLDDLRSAARSVVRARAVTAVLLTSLAIGTGANATVFGAIRSLLFRPPAGVASPGMLTSIHTSQFGGGVYGGSSFPDYLSLQESAAFEAIAAVDDDRGENATLGDVMSRVRVASVTGNFFETLGMTPFRGRLLEGADGTRPANPAVISYVLWQAFGAANPLVGTQFQLGSTAYTVVGVTPERFRGLAAERLCDVWIPLPEAGLGDRGDRLLSLLSLLPPPLDEAKNDLERLTTDLAARFPETNLGTANDPAEPRRFTAVQYSQLDPEARVRAATVAAIVGASVALLLVSACVNAGSLLLSRGFARQRELAIKMALGAPRRRIVRQLLLESTLLTLGGALLGLLFAFWIGLFLPSLFAPEHAALLDTSVNAWLILAAVLVVIVAGCLFGVAPAVQATSAPAIIALRANAGGISEHQGGRRLRAMLVTSQVALSTLLLLGTGVMISSLSTALAGDESVPVRDIAIVTTEIDGGRVSPVRGIPYNDNVEPSLRRLPGVAAVGWASTPPLGAGVLKDFRMQVGARATTDAAEFAVTIVSNNYFSAVGMPIVEGRAFDGRDTGMSEMVVIVDEQLARQHFGASAVGQFLINDRGEQIRIAGVVRGPRQRAFQGASRPTVYQPLSQELLTRGYLCVRTTQPAASLLDALTGGINSVPDVEVDRPLTLQQYLSSRLAIDRMITALVATCGVLALMLSMIGVYGVMIDAVQRRTREIGLRVALGAGRTQIARLVLTEAIAVAALGMCVGLALTVAGDRLTATWLAGIAPLNLEALYTAPAILIAMVAAAAVIPLRKALRVSATIALKAE